VRNQKVSDLLAVLYDSDNDDREDDAVEEDFKYDSLKKKY
jgi:hypothetical protein